MRRLLFAICIIGLCNSGFAQTVSIVVKENVKIKEKPDPLANFIASVQPGESIKVTSYSAGYYSVDIGSKTGFINEIFLPDDISLKPLKDGYLKLHPERKKNTKVFTGMSPQDLVDVYGSPKDINKDTGSWGTNEQWIYVLSGGTTKYFYFTNDKLTATQTR